MSDDLIRRSDAIEAIEVVDWYHQNRNKDMVSGANSDEHQAWYKADDIYKALEAIPTIEPKRGEWITIDTKVISVPIYWTEEERQSDERGAGIREKCKCSACGWKTNFIGYRKLGVNKSFNFCPNCGADMTERGD